jgi:hypothetical protein
VAFDLTDFLAVAALALPLAAAVLAYLRSVLGYLKTVNTAATANADSIKGFETKIGDLNHVHTATSANTESIKGLEMKVGLFWKMIESEIPKLLHSPHTPELDALLERFLAHTLDLEGAIHMKEMLQADLTSDPKSDALMKVMMLAVLEERIAELTSTAGTAEKTETDR